MTASAFRTSLGAVLLAGTVLAPAFAHDIGDHGSKHGAELFGSGALHATGAETTHDGHPPLYDGLGDMGMAISTTEPQAQAYFDQGFRLVWGFNHAEAVRSFRAARAIDPACAMCSWGEAFALGPNINDAMAEAAAGPAWEAVRRARALAAQASDKELALIEALAARYAPDATADRAALDAAWAEAIGDVAVRFPQDADVLVLHADALMNLQPWDYWEEDGRAPKGRAAEIVATLERALELEPDHPAALHLYIHAVEASAEPDRAEAAADRLRGAAPAAGHLTHMPAHIYARVGRHHDSMAVNRDAIAADESFLSQAGDAASRLYRYGYYPHNVHYLLISAQMAGLAKDVIASADQLVEITSDGVSQELAWVQAIKTAPYSGHAQFSDPDTILALPDPGDRFPFVKGFWHYARGLAQVRQDRLAEAESEADAIARLIETGDMGDLEAQYLPAPDVLAIARDLVRARAAAARGDFRTAEMLLRAAIVIEDGIGYMEPPYWYYPVRQTLGGVLLEAGRPREAIAVFQAALEQMPRNGWALWGLAEAQRAAGEESGEAEAAFRKVWLGDGAILTRDRL
jgi:tetratricopeptide (TPR) repeat protein